MRKIFTLFFVLALVCVKGRGQQTVTVFSESFEQSNWIGAPTSPNNWTTDEPAGSNKSWHRNDVTTSWTSPNNGSPASTGANGTSKYARFHSYGLADGKTSFFQTPFISTNTSNPYFLSFWFINPNGSDKMLVYFSKDGNFSNSQNYTIDNSVSSWTNFSIPIPASYLGTTFKIQFRAYSDNGNSDIGLDEVTVNQLTNDNCSGAIAVVPDAAPISGTTVGADQQYAPCNGGGKAYDVWYKFTAPATAKYTINVTTTNFDAVLNTFTGCGSGNSVTCQDGPGASGTESVQTPTLTAGTVYYYRVYGFNNTTGAFTTNVIQGPVNDDCSNATTVTPGSVCNSVSGSLVNSTVSSLFTASDVWYTFTVPTKAPYTIRAVPNNFDIGIKLYKTCGTTTSVAEADFYGNNKAEAIETVTLDPGTYYYRIYNTNLSASGTFTTCVIAGTPANDLCANAITLLANTPTAGTMANATLSQPQPQPNNKFVSDVWYKFVPCGNTINIQAPSTNQDIDIVVYQTSNCPNSSTPIVKNSGNGVLAGETTGNFTVIAGASYYIRIGLDENTYDGSIPGDFTITVTSAVTQPTATLTTNNATQTVCNNSPIAPIKYNLGNYTSAMVSPLPTGVTSSIVSNVLTISGTPNTTTVSNPYTVTVTNSCAIATVNGTVTVNPLADATITSVSPICSGQQSTLTISSVSGGTIKYQFGSTQPTVTLPPGGNTQINTGALTSNATYSIISVTGTTCPNTAPNSSTTVIVNPLPTATITSGGSYVQLGNTDQLTGSTNSFTKTWSSSNTAAATVNGSGLVTAVNTGVTTITYTVTNATTTCSNSDTKVVNVTADYITRANGNFSNIATWTKYTQNGPANATVIPASINTIEVAHALTLDQDFEVGTGKSFNIITNGSFIIQPGKMFKALGTVNFGSHLVTVQSNDSTAGAIGRMANTIGGANNVRVERFIPLTPTNGSLGRTGRAWRLITSPITNQTIKQAWQEGKTWQGGTTETTTGLGTIITGEGDLNHMSSSFDFIPASAHHTSIKQYAPAPGGGAWVQLPGNATTGTNIPVSSQPAWMLFVRGDRTANTPTAKSATTLRATGTLNQSPVTVTVSGSNAYTLVGNPYASAINFDQILSTSQGIQPGFLVWNSKLGTYGAYVRVAKGNGGNYRTVPFPLTGNDNPTLDENAKYIQSSEGFFVAPATPGTDGSLTISEASKPSSDSVGINPYREGSDNDKKIWVNLNLKESDTASTLADGVLVKFASDYAPGVDGYDALKLSNFNENLSVLAQSQNLMVEARPDVAKTDTVELKVWNLVKRPYQLQMKSEHFDSSLSVHAWLEDNYLKTKQDLNLQGEVTTVDFDVTSEAASYAADRFRIVFENKTLGALPVTLTSIKATPKNNGVEVSWTVTNEQNMKQYVVERSTDGGRTYAAFAEQAAANTSVSNNYIGFDAAPLRGDNIYRIKMEGKEGSISYSATVKVTISEEGGIQISLYPNPVSRTRQGGKASLQLKGLSAGVYSLNVYSHGGQRVYQKKITVLAASASQTEDIRLNGGLAQGSYEVRFTNSKGKVIYTQQLIVTE